MKTASIKWTPRTEVYYRNRLEKARNRAMSMGFNPQPHHVLMLHDTGSETKGTVSFRETLVHDETAIEKMVAGKAIRISVTNGERTVQLYIDPE